MSRLLRALSSRSYFLARWLALAAARRTARTWREAAPVLLYQMGKVGSTTLLGALRASWPGEVYHLHTLRPDHLAAEEQVFRRHFAKRRRIPRYVVEGLFLAERLDRPPGPDGRWAIVSLVRDPVARNVATYFQTLDAHRSDTNLEERARSMDPEDVLELQRHFVEHFDHDSALTWFDRELKHVFGVDVLAEDWLPDRGFGVYESATARVLLLRLEDLDRVGAMALEGFFGRQGFALPRRNVAEQKYYAQAYRRFKESLVLPAELLEHMYSSPLALRFFTTEERAALRRAWSGQRIPTAAPLQGRSIVP